MKKTLSWLVVPAALCAFAASAHAHAIWIERDAKNEASVFFGEYGEGVREKSGGKLDEVAALDARTPSGALVTVKMEDRVSLGAVGGEVTAQNLSVPVKDYTKYKIGVVKPYFYARFTSGAASPSMRLDATREGKGARVYFDGKPLGGEKAVLTAPNGWSKEFKTDGEGRIEFDLPWPGLYVLEVTHAVDVPGAYEGVDYAAERHRATLSFLQKNKK